MTLKGLKTNDTLNTKPTLVNLASEGTDGIVKCGDRSPRRGSEQAEVLPTELEGTVFLNQGVSIGREHPKQEGGLGSRISG